MLNNESAVPSQISYSTCSFVVTIRLPFKLGDPVSILGRTSTQGLKIIEEKVLPLH